MPMRIETLATCHNRREKTLQALTDLHVQELPEGVEMRHTIVDDRSTDGTSSAVNAVFPDVDVVHGDGDLFWAGGMRHGWNESVKKKSFDYLLVYNDDVRLHRDAVARLLEAGYAYTRDGGVRSHAVVGGFMDDEGNTSYGGVVRSSQWHTLRFKQVEPPAKGYAQVDSMNMNACLISKEALAHVGFLSKYFKHTGADYEYGLKLRAHGGSVLIAREYIGICRRNEVKGSSAESGIAISDRYKRLIGVKEQPPLQRMKYFKKYGGKLWFMLFVLPYFSVLVKHFSQRK